MLAMTMTAPASAFTVASPQLGHSFAAEGQVQKAWWDRWGRWHPNYWGYGPYWGPHRHCWMSPWGWRCRWW